MAKLSPTLQLRIQARAERAINLKNKDKQIQDQEAVITKLIEISLYAIKHDFGKDGLDLCRIATVGDKEILLVNIIKFNDPHIQSINATFLDLHATCLLEMDEIATTNGIFSDMYNYQIVSANEYCSLLGQSDDCELEKVL